MKKEYIAQFESAEQISPDDFRRVTPTLKVTDTTTIGEIVSWMHSKGNRFDTEFKVIIIDSRNENRTEGD